MDYHLVISQFVLRDVHTNTASNYTFILHSPHTMDLSLSPPQECCQQVGDFRLWLSPTNRQRSQRFALGDVTSLAAQVLSGHIPVSCSIRASFLLNSATCRPDGSCGLQMACLIALLDNSTPSLPPHQRQHDHLSWTDLQQYLQPHRLQCGLSRSHFSPWYCPDVITSSLPWARQALLEELVAQPLPEQVDQGSFTRITSRLRSSLPPEVLVLHRNRLLEKNIY